MVHTQTEISRRILIVDDNPETQEDFHTVLGIPSEGKSGFGTVPPWAFGRPCEIDTPGNFDLKSAYQGEEAVDYIKASMKEENPFSLAFVDINMPPGLDGIQTTAKLWEVDPDLHIVLCTAYSDYPWENVMKQLGHTDRLVILKKPFDSVVVLQIANALTEKWRLFQESKRRIENLKCTKESQEKVLKLTQERYQLITENATDLIAILDDDLNCRYTSPSYEHVLGYSPEELRNSGLFSYIQKDDQNRILRLLKLKNEKAKSWKFEYRFKHKNGRYLTIESRGRYIQNTASYGGQFVFYGHDITDRKKMEVELRHAQKMESIGQLAAGIAHEINTPTQYVGDNLLFLNNSFNSLLNLLGRVHDIVETPTDPPGNQDLIEHLKKIYLEADWGYLAEEIPEALEQTMNGVSHVSRIVKCMKEFSHPGTEDKIPMDLNKAIESVITVSKNEWKYVADLETDLESDLPCTLGYPGEMSQAVLNLITNSAHAIADVSKDENQKGKIKITTRYTGSQLEIRISDTGSGIPKAIREKIFEPFFTTKEVGKGSGQGLSIVHSVIVEKHGGKIDTLSEPGKGTTFVLSIPAEIPARREAV